MPIDLIITWELLPGSSNAQCNTRHILHSPRCRNFKTTKSQFKKPMPFQNTWRRPFIPQRDQFSFLRQRHHGDEWMTAIFLLLQTGSGRIIRTSQGTLSRYDYGNRPNKSKRASHLADEYILETDCSINAVVVLDIDIDYRSAKGTTRFKEFTATAMVEAQLWLL